MVLLYCVAIYTSIYGELSPAIEFCQDTADAASAGAAYFLARNTWIIQQLITSIYSVLYVTVKKIYHEACKDIVHPVIDVYVYDGPNDVPI